MIGHLRKTVKRTRVFILDEIPSLNKGEEAILLGIAHTFRLVGDCSISILSFYPEIDTPRYAKFGIKVISSHGLFPITVLRRGNLIIRLAASLFVAIKILIFVLVSKVAGKFSLRLFKSSVWSELYSADIIVMCHDGVGLLNLGLLPFMPLYMIPAMKSLGKIVVISGNSQAIPHSSRIKPVFKPIVRRLVWVIKAIAKKVDLITVRESFSYMSIRELLGDKAPVYFTADRAFMATADRNRVLRKERARNVLEYERLYEVTRRPLIGVILTNAIGRRVGKENIFRLIAQMLDKIIEELGVTILLIPHGYEPYLNDVEVILGLYSSIKNKDYVRIITREYEFDELHDVIRRLDVLLSSRLHATISAFLGCTPFIFITHSEDIRRYVLDVTNQTSWICLLDKEGVHGLYSKVVALWFKREKVREEIKRTLPEVLRRASLDVKMIKAILMRKSLQNS